MHNMTHLLHRIVKMTTAKLILILMIDTSCMYKLKNDTNQKKTLTTHSIVNCIKITAKSSIALTTSDGKNEKKILSNLTRKKTTKTHH